MTPFFITGLPRSGTAWLANLFTTGKTLCYHEPSPNLVVQTMNRHPGRRVGASDSSLVRRFAEVTTAFPSARWLYVARPIEETVKSLMAFTAALGNGLDEKLLREELQKDIDLAGEFIRDTDRVAVVEYSSITQHSNVMAEAWHWLVPEVKFDMYRWAILREFNVQQDLRATLGAKMRANLKQTASAFTAPQAQQTTN